MESSKAVKRMGFGGKALLWVLGTAMVIEIAYVWIAWHFNQLGIETAQNGVPLFYQPLPGFGYLLIIPGLFFVALLAGGSVLERIFTSLMTLCASISIRGDALDLTIDQWLGHMLGLDELVQAKSFDLTGKVDLSPNEYVVKSYHACTLRDEKMDLFLTLTTFRVILYGLRKGIGKAHYHQEFLVSDLRGNDSAYQPFFEWVVFLVCTGILLATGIGLRWFLYLEGFLPFFPGFLFLAVGVLVELLLMRFCWNTYFYLKFLTGAGTVISSCGKEEKFGQFSSSVLKSKLGDPTTDTDQFMQEFGSLVEDIKHMGVDVVEYRGSDLAKELKRQKDAQSS